MKEIKYYESNAPACLEPIGEIAAALMYRIAYIQWTSNLVGMPDPKERFDRMRNPLVGDLVIETSTCYRRNDGSNIGVLLKRIGPSEFLIRLLSTGGEYRWTNAGFVAVLTGEGYMDDPTAEGGEE